MHALDKEIVFSVHFLFLLVLLGVTYLRENK